ncbi:MAG TPA: hypothetical protein VIL86_16570 [Tepidisphaeraceae bacterium]
MKAIKFFMAAVVLILAVSARRTAAQTTQPAGGAEGTNNVSQWPVAVKALAEALVRGDKLGLNDLLADQKGGAVIAEFSGESATVEVLLNRTAKATVLGAHGYLQPPLAMAADLAADFKNTAGVPEEFKRRMIPGDDAEMNRANATAVQWLAKVLDPAANQAVAVIVLWPPLSSPSPANPAAPTLTGKELGGGQGGQAIFVLVKGEEVAPNRFRVRQVVFGYPAGGKSESAKR